MPLEAVAIALRRVGDVARELRSTNLRASCDDPRREKAEDGCKGGIGWQGVADCVPCGRLECAMLGIGRGARLACARAAQRRRCNFSVIR